MAFDQRMTPSLVEAAGTYYLPATVNRQHGFGPVVDGFLLSRPMGEVRVRDLASDGLSAKLVTKPVVGRDHVLRHVRSLYVTDGVSLWTTVAVERFDGTPLLAGLPVRHRRRGPVSRTADAAVATSAGRAQAGAPSTNGRRGPLRRPLRDDPGAGGVRLAADPRGYGNPDEGWRHLVASPRRSKPHRLQHRTPCTSSPCATAPRARSPHLRRHTGGPDDRRRGVAR